MNLQAFLFITVTFGLTFLFLQRADPTRRDAVRNFAWFMVIILGVYVWLRAALFEAVLGLLLALLLNGIFWVLVGRYNPAHSSDEIHVLGMDD